MVAYTFMGGLWAVTVTDFVQFVILAVAVLVVFPLVDRQGGRLPGLWSTHSPPGFFHLTNEKYNWFYIVLLVGIYCRCYSSTNWHLIQKYFCVPTEKDAKKVGLAGGGAVHGRAAVDLHPRHRRHGSSCPTQLLSTTRRFIPRLCAVLLPVGMLGLIIAAMFSATMGNLSSHFNVRASVLTNDVYRRLCGRTPARGSWCSQAAA